MDIEVKLLDVIKISNH